MSVGIWQITDDGPKRMRAANVELEQHLEDWIAEDTSLLQAGLVVVGKQVYTAAGPLDLLAVDFQGRWNVIEIKRGQVHRETVAQAIDYASCIADMQADELRAKADAYLKDHPVGDLHTLNEVLEQRGLELNDEEERDVALMVVGTSQDPGLERMVNFLSGRGNLPVTVISFEVFALPSGEQVLVRELTESDENPEVSTRRKPQRKMPTLEEFYKLAESAGTRSPIQKFVEAGERAGLSCRVYRESLFLSSPVDERKLIAGIMLKPTEDGRIRVWVGADPIAEIFDIPQERVERALGKGNLALPASKKWTGLRSASLTLGGRVNEAVGLHVLRTVRRQNCADDQADDHQHPRQWQDDRLDPGSGGRRVSARAANFRMTPLMISKPSPTTTNPRSDRPQSVGLKRIFLALAAACLTGTWTVPALAQEPAAKPGLGETPYGGLKYKMPEIMLISWANWPEKQEDRDAVAALMKAKGFNAAETTLEGLEALRKHGMYARLGTPEFEIAPKLRNDPNVLAYFISDRRSRGSFPKFEQMTRAFEKQDPTHPTMINNRANYNQFPEFVEVVKPTMLVYYHYQFRKGEHQERNLIYLDMFRKLALKQNIPLVRCTDAKQLPGHLRHEHFTSLAYSVQGFSYSPCHHFGFKKEDDGKITPTFGEFFEPLSQVALDIRTLSPILVKLKSIDVFHAEPPAPGGRKAPEDSWVAISGAHTFTGIFKDEAGKDFLFPVNNDPAKEHETTLRLKGATAAERMDKKTGKWIPLTVTSEGDRGIVKVTLAPGDGELLKIVRN